MTAARSVTGDAPKRREDLRFVTGRGRYLDDLVFEGLVHAMVLRSPQAHAGIERIDTGRARAGSGVLAPETESIFWNVLRAKPAALMVPLL